MRYLQNFVMTFTFCPYFYSMLSLKNAKIGKSYRVLQISEYAVDKIRRRLFDLGFTSGQYVKLVRKSLIGKVFLIEIRGYTLSIRESVAQKIIIETV